MAELPALYPLLQPLRLFPTPARQGAGIPFSDLRMAQGSALYTVGDLTVSSHRITHPSWNISYPWADHETLSESLPTEDFTPIFGSCTLTTRRYLGRLTPASSRLHEKLNVLLALS